MKPALVLDHIGIAVEQTIPLTQLFELLGFQQSHSESVPSQGVNTLFFPVAESAPNIEVLEVTDPQGTVAKFLAKRGPGIHHLSFRLKTGSLDTLCFDLSSRGVRLVYDKPQPGAHSMRVNFIHPASAGGVLIEIMEPSN
jgi:methylmalonyl-CoA epimerase